MKASLISALLTVTLAGLLPAPCGGESVVVQWVRYHNTNQETGVPVVDRAGNVIVAGGYSITIDQYLPNVAKYAAEDGALIWRHDPPMSEGHVAGWMLRVDETGNVIIAGQTGMNKWDIYRAKHSSASGARLWHGQYNAIASDNDRGRSIAVDQAGNIFITGYSELGSLDWEYYTAKYQASTGALLWDRRYNAHAGPGLKYDQASGIAVDSSGNAIVTGGSFNSNGNQDIYTAKYAATDGAIVWEVRYNGPANRSEFGSEVVADSTGNAVISGWSTRTDDQRDYYVAKYAAADGTLIWEKRFAALSYEHLGVAIDGADNVVVTARDYYSGSYAYTAKYAAADGEVLWENREGNGQSFLDLAVDSANNVIVTGSSPGTGVGKDCYTAKYAGADGTLLWERRFHGPTRGDDGGYAVTVDTAGGVIVSGRATGGDGNPIPYTSYTVKYAPTDADHDGLLDSWEIEHFGGTETQIALDDTDGDGAEELLELAFGTDPKSPASVPALASVVESGYLTVTIAKQPGVTYFVETGATLESDFSAANTTVLIDDASTLKVRDNIPVAAAPARFVRVRVTAAP